MKEKMVIRSSDSVFLNSKCVFVEYIDIIKSPYFLLLYAMSTSKESLKEPFDVSPIRNAKTSTDLAEWYYGRKNQNPFIDLIPDDKIGDVDLDKVDELLNHQLEEASSVVKVTTALNFASVIKKLMHSDSILVPKVYIYYPYDNPVIREDVENTFDNPDIQFVCGDLKEILKNVPNDSTFVFSDITNVLLLEELGKLDMSSIIIPLDYNYNKDENGRFIVDTQTLAKDHVFKLNYFLASTDEM